MGMAAPLLGAGASVGSGLIEMQNRQKAQQQQRQNIDNWYAYQAAQRQMEYGRQNKLRIEADTSRMKTLNNVGGIGQKSMQQTEEARLAPELMRGTSAASSAPTASPGSITAGSQPGALTGQSGGDSVFTSDLARRLNNAAQDSRQRIQALAGMSSYGDSFGGLGTMIPMEFGQSASDINMANNFRKGSMAAYDVAKQVAPQQVNYRQSPAAMGLSALGGALSGMGGGGF
jgi:hypothetical protein